MAWDAPPLNLVASGQAAANRVSGLFDDFQSGMQAGDQQRVRSARRSLADLGTGPDGQFDPQLASQRLMAAGDIQGARTLADLGMAEEDRKFRQMQYQQGQATAADERAYRRDRDVVDDRFKTTQLDISRSNSAARAPDTTTIYDPATGRPQAAQWDPDQRVYQPIGGVKAPTAPVSAAPRTTTIYDPQTGQPQAAQWDANANSWQPIGGVKKPAPRQVPPSIQKAEAEDLQDVQTISQLNDMLGKFSTQIDSGALTLGPLENVQSRFQNWAGNSSPNSRNFASFQAGLEKMRNESLRLNKGVQTEGDAVRAWNEVFANINDPAVVKQRLQEIVGFNQAAATFKTNQIKLRRDTNGLDPLDVSGMVSVPGKDNGRVQAGTPQQRAGASTASEGQTATNPQTGEKLMFRGGQWVPAQ